MSCFQCGTFRDKKLEKVLHGYTDHHTKPVLYSYCGACGEKIRPDDPCCREAFERGYSYCPECGVNVVQFR